MKARAPLGSRYFLITFVCFALTFLTIQGSLADRVKVLHDDEQAFQARVDLLRQARSELFVAYFVVRDDTASVSGFALLLDAANRGVRVQVLLDAFHHDISLPYLKALTSHPNIEIRVFNRFSFFHLLRTLRRNHEKIIIADSIHSDGLHYVTGGRNVSNKYFGFGRTRNFDDLDIYVHGESARTARYDYFVKLWDSKLVSEISLGAYSEAHFDGRFCSQTKKEDDICTRKLAARTVAYATAWDRIRGRQQAMVAGEVPGVDWNSSMRWDRIAREVGKVQFLYDPTDTKKSDKGIATQLYELIVSDESIRNITVLSPYVILTKRGARLLSILKDRGVEITLVTNSLNSTDNILAQAGYANDKQWLLDQGLKIYQYIGPDTIHAKAIIINDGESVLIGSYNFDPRSAKLNREVGAQFHATNDVSGTIIRELNDMTTYYISRSHPLDQNGIPAGFDEEHPNTSFVKKAMLAILRPLVAIPTIKKNL